MTLEAFITILKAVTEPSEEFLSTTLAAIQECTENRKVTNEESPRIPSNAVDATAAFQ
jgi:hypothetical protein